MKGLFIILSDPKIYLPSGPKNTRVEKEELVEVGVLHANFVDACICVDAAIVAEYLGTLVRGIKVLYVMKDYG